MQFTADRNLLAEAITNVSTIIQSNPVTPVYAGMSITASERFVWFTSSDRDTALSSFVNADIRRGGLITLPGKLLADIIRSLPDKEVTFSCPETSGQPVTITCGRSVFTLRPYTDPYPGVPADCQTPATVDAESLSKAIRAVIPAVSQKDANPVLHGLLLAPRGDRLALVATDRYRVAAFELPWDAGLPDCVIPAGAAERFRRGIDSDEVYLGWDGSGCTLKSGNFTMTTRQIAGTYAEWRRFFPEGPSQAAVDVETLTLAVKRAQLAAGQDDPVRLRFTGGEVHVSAGVETTAEEAVDADYTGDGFETLLGVGYLLDALTGCDAEICQFGFTESLKPVRLTSGRFKNVILPRRRT
jgi:DNA polymerase III subunit beta